jgi:prepilin-type N-terminal cleavage/methylation domain-containing protein
MTICLEHNVENTPNAAGMRKGFSLAEVIASITIGAMVLVAVLGIYNRAEKSASRIIQNLGSSRLSSEVLQRIAEDLDRIISSDSDTTVKIENKFKNGFPAAKLTITKNIKDGKNKELKFEEIVWQSIYNYENPDVGLVLYRSYSGIALEDKVLDKNKEQTELARAVPICSGVTFFSINALKGETSADKWNGSPPSGITVTMSFAEPIKRINGTLDVLDEEKITRTIAIDRTRKINFAIETTESSENVETPAQTEIPNEGRLSLGRPRKIEDDE